MEWGLSRFDGFVAAFPAQGKRTPFPRPSSPHTYHLLPLGVAHDVYRVNGTNYSLDGSCPLSATASYLVITRLHADAIRSVIEPPERIVVLEDFIEHIPPPDGDLSAEEQEQWLMSLLPHLQSNLRADPARFNTAQASWRYNALRRMGRDWKSYDIEQNQFWFTLNHAPYAEAFMLADNRSERAIVACDLRSAYGWAIATQDYPDPDTWVSVDGIPEEHGPYIALCRLSKPTKWLSRHHPWQYTERGESEPFYWNKNDTIAGWFTNFELQAVKGLCDVEVLEVKVPIRYGAHPMANQIKNWYTKRQSEPQCGSVWKTKVASAHAWTVQYRLETVGDADIDIEMANRFIARRFETDKRCAFEKYDAQLGKINYIHAGTKAGVWLPTVWTSLLVRTRVFTIMRWIHENLPGAQCAYVNVDSIHWTMPKEYQEKFCDIFGKSRWCGESIGDARIEYVSEHGFWFRPGAYVLWNKNNIVTSTLGENPWENGLQRGFWDQNLQAVFNTKGSVNQCWYQRPTSMRIWVNRGSVTTQLLVDTLRFKQAAWRATRDTLR